MKKVTFELVADDAHFTTQDAEGKAVRLKSGETYTTSDPFVVRELDMQQGIRRVQAKKEEEK